MADVIYGCRLLVLTELDESTGLPPETSPSIVRIETPQQASITPVFAEGQTQELRGGDKLLAVIEDDPELRGLDITFSDALLNGEAMALIAGGTYEDKKYTAPSIGTARSPFQAELYVAQYEQASVNAGDVAGYIKFTFSYVKGRIPTFSAQDRAFMVPQFTLNCRENSTASKSIFEWEAVTTLPVDTPSD